MPNGFREKKKHPNRYLCSACSGTPSDIIGSTIFQLVYLRDAKNDHEVSAA